MINKTIATHPESGHGVTKIYIRVAIVFILRLITIVLFILCTIKGLINISVVCHIVT